MSEQFFSGGSKKAMTNSQLKKIKRNMQNSYDKIHIIAEKEKIIEGDRENMADDILAEKLKDL